MRILSGIQPSGTLHLGNFLGMIQPMVQSQDNSELFCFLANMHSLTSVFEASRLQSFTNEAIIDLLALGMDPERSVFWIQSDVPEVTELAWYLNNVTPVGLLERCHSYKDKVAKNLPANNGLFSYPVLMAADILMYQTNVVPVGKDQKQHVEVARDIAIKFNQAYGEAFTVPEPRIREEVAVVPGIDGQKMSKSYGNTLDLFAHESQLKKRVMSIVTDPTPLEQPKDPDKSIVFAIYKLFASQENVNFMEQRLRAGGYGYGDAKKELFSALWDYFLPYRKRREDISKNPDYVAEVRRKGAHKARAAGLPTLEKVRRLVGVTV
jgi:tryptophanyl-tRNA synthetase